MKNYKVDSDWCRVFPVMILAILTIGPSALAQQHKAQPPKSVRLYVFDCGSLNIPDTSPYQFKKGDLATTYMSAVLPGGASEGNHDVGHRCSS